MYEVAKWIEPGEIAQDIFFLDEVNTVEQAKKVWQEFEKKELRNCLRRTAQALKEKGVL
jgi:hypothetical protein